MADVEAVHELYQDPDIQKYLGGSNDINDSKRQIQHAIKIYEKKGYGLLLICFKESKKVIGCCKIQRSPLEPPSDLEIIYGLLPKWRGKGYATETVKKVLSWIFGKVDNNQIIGRVKSDNTASTKLMKRLNFKKIGDRTDPLVNEVEYIFSINKSNISTKP